MATQIHSNRTGTAIVRLNGLAKDPVWSTDDNGATVTAAGQEPGPSDRFTAILTPVGISGSTTVRLTVQKIDDSGALSGSANVQVVEGPATQVDSMTIVEN